MKNKFEKVSAVASAVLYVVCAILLLVAVCQHDYIRAIFWVLIMVTNYVQSFVEQIRRAHLNISIIASGSKEK